ncbi:MAG: fumarylacetoacetate hydrolase family protein, partial [Alphaproteobacteria bacterium]|nr:fumarylacetoacetate hydrolase family protein [Alphaproteobacteria bacterium]
GKIELLLNGVKKQSGDLNQMIWKIPEMISFLSTYFELAAGDVILTGTPAGVGSVVVGDVLIARIEGLGELRVQVVES